MSDEPFTIKQYRGLSERRRDAIHCLYEIFSGNELPKGSSLNSDQIEDEMLLFFPASDEGTSIPSVLCDGDVVFRIQDKLHAIARAGAVLAHEEKPFNPQVIVEITGDFEARVLVTSWMEEYRIYARDRIKTWGYHFMDLDDLADEVLRWKQMTLEGITRWSFSPEHKVAVDDVITVRSS